MAITFISKADSVTATSGTGTLAATKPATVSAGNWLLAAVAVNTPTNADSAITAPTGWTLVAQGYDASTSTSGGIRLNLYQRTATSTEPATYTFTAAAPVGRLSVSILNYSGAVGIQAGEAVVTIPSTSTTTKSAGPLTVGTNRRVLSVFADRDQNQIWTVGDTLRTTNTSPNTNFVVQDTNGGVTPGTYTKTVTESISSSTAVGIIAAILAASTTGPDTTLTLATGYAVVTAATTGLVGTGSYTISPTANTTAIDGGFLVKQGSSEVTYTVTTADSGSSTTSTKTVTVPALSTGGTTSPGAGYSETLIKTAGVFS